MRIRHQKARLPRFARRRPAEGNAPAPRPAWPRTVLDVLHKLLTAGAALATILRLFF